MTAPAPAPVLAAARRRAVSGFSLYDVACSAFFTTVISAIGGPFVTSVAEAAADSDGRVSFLLASPRAVSVYPYALTACVLLQALLLPVLGALADRPDAKRALLRAGTVVGAVATVALAAVPDGQVYAAVGALIVANTAVGAAVLAYNAHLADVAEVADRDRVSARAFAWGYAGGAFVLALSLGLVTAAEPLGLTTGSAGRLSIALSGAWWLAVGLVAIRRLDAARLLPRVTTPPPPRLREALGELRRLPGTLRYLVAFLLFNNAIQTVIALAGVFLAQELFVARGQSEDDATGFLLTLVLLIQVVAVAGAVGAARIAVHLGAKRTILLTLVGWVGVVLYAGLALDSIPGAYAAGVVIALVLGGSQALARSLFSTMVPDGRQASFFGLYGLAERGSTWVGTLVFAVVLDVTGSYRGALVSLLVLFVAGGLLLAATDTDEAVAQAQADHASTGPSVSG